MKSESEAPEDRTITSRSPSRISVEGDEKKGSKTIKDVEGGGEEETGAQTPSVPNSVVEFPEGGFQGWATVLGA